jgi:hypothetical protein
MFQCLATFAAGALVEGISVLWVHYSERGKALIAALLSCLGALTFIIGVDDSIRDRKLEVFFVLGYGAGSYFAIKIKARLKEASVHAS